MFALTGEKDIEQLRHFYFKLHDSLFANPPADRGKELQRIISEELGDSSMTGDSVYMHKVKQPRYVMYGGHQLISIKFLCREVDLS